ncbi:MAG TPA: cytochrome C, partial [Planctomycetota bacterium]|nr:cytochrome C [Planctomycetota bacterium]
PGRSTPVTTKGLKGAEKGPFQLDVLTVPYENPSKSYMRLTGVDFFAGGKRAAVCTMDGDVWTVDGIDDGLEQLTWKRYASGLFQSLGLRIVKDEVYVLGRDQITRLHDLDKDGEADYYENFNNDCGVTPAYHEFTHDLQTDSKGNFYYLKGSNLGGSVVPYHGSLVKVSADGKTSERWTSGFRAPNGMSVGPDDVLTTSDNQGNWVPATPINYITKQGQFCGFVPCSYLSPAPKERPDPLCWIPYSQDNSGGGQLWAVNAKWGPFNGELFHLSYGKCVLFHVLREQVGDVMQGGVVKFPFKFISGGMRGRFNPADGQMYFVGMRGWQTDGSRDGCFQRIRYTGAPINQPLSAKVSASGIAITFTDKLDAETAGAADSYSAEWCNIKWTGDYGSPEFWVSQPAKKGREPLAIQGATLSEDGKTVTLKFEGLKPVHHLVIKYKIRGADGAPINQELDYTINRIP